MVIPEYDVCDCGKRGSHAECTLKDDLLLVSVVVLPNGETLWMDSKQYNLEYARKVITSWKEQHPEFDNLGCSMGFVEIKMPVSQYKKIHATNTFNWPPL